LTGLFSENLAGHMLSAISRISLFTNSVL
jgi:hypothetical protein